ncbi:hypothetical protein CYMTET_37285 [Cymbomonas tetramitiformis]|uniref:AP2/ERF domain-containing protein n=1 Tax=Cymbomonas tetramitiformis TaxID=36881 RepID=A0AAE0CEC2_9CHLO|nr:hypothetical protein CYMTET_37285 [Cymbomonas tetramitiformis]
MHSAYSEVYDTNDDPISSVEKSFCTQTPSGNSDAFEERDIIPSTGHEEVLNIPSDPHGAAHDLTNVCSCVCDMPPASESTPDLEPLEVESAPGTRGPLPAAEAPRSLQGEEPAGECGEEPSAGTSPAPRLDRSVGGSGGTKGALDTPSALERLEADGTPGRCGPPPAHEVTNVCDMPPASESTPDLEPLEVGSAPGTRGPLPAAEAPRSLQGEEPAGECGEEPSAGTSPAPRLDRSVGGSGGTKGALDTPSALERLEADGAPGRCGRSPAPEAPLSPTGEACPVMVEIQVAPGTCGPPPAHEVTNVCDMPPALESTPDLEPLEVGSAPGTRGPLPAAEAPRSLQGEEPAGECGDESWVVWRRVMWRRVMSHECDTLPAPRLDSSMGGSGGTKGALDTPSALERLEADGAPGRCGRSPAPEAPLSPKGEEPHAVPAVATPAKARMMPRWFRPGDRVSCLASFFDVPELKKRSDGRGHQWRWSYEKFGEEWYSARVEGVVMAHASVTAPVKVRCDLDSAVTERTHAKDLRLERAAPGEEPAGECGDEPGEGGLQGPRLDSSVGGSGGTKGALDTPSALERLEADGAPGRCGRSPAPEAPLSPKGEGCAVLAVATPAKARMMPRWFRPGDRVSCLASFFDVPELKKRSDGRGHQWRWSYEKFGEEWYSARVEGVVMAHASVTAPVKVRCDLDSAVTERTHAKDLRLERAAPGEEPAGECGDEPVVRTSRAPTAEAVDEPQLPGPCQEGSSKRVASATFAHSHISEKWSRLNQLHVGDIVSCFAYEFDEPEERRLAIAEHRCSKKGQSWRWSYNKFGANAWWGARVQGEVIEVLEGSKGLVKVRWDAGDGDESLAPRRKLRLIQAAEDAQQAEELAENGAPGTLGSGESGGGSGQRLGAKGGKRSESGRRLDCLCCRFCGRGYENRNGCSSHESRCWANPNHGTGGGAKRGSAKPGRTTAPRGTTARRPSCPAHRAKAPTAVRRQGALQQPADRILPVGANPQWHIPGSPAAAVGGLVVTTMELQQPSARPSRTNFLTKWLSTRLLKTSIFLPKRGDAALPPSVIELMGLRYELLLSKLVERQVLYTKVKDVENTYVAVSGPGLPTICLREELERLADFAGLPSWRKVQARLELLQSPVHEEHVFELETEHFEVQEAEALSSATGEPMGDGCGFIPEPLLRRLLKQSVHGHLRKVAVQVRIVSPSLGIFKGMLFCKPGIDRVQLPPSMRKVGASRQPPDAHGALRGKAVLLIKNTFPSQTNVALAKRMRGQPAVVERKVMKQMLLWLLGSLKVPEEALQTYRAKELDSHTSMVGVADPTGCLPRDTIFVSGLPPLPPGRREIFVTRFPCVKPQDGRMLPVVTARPPAMPPAHWDWLQGLPFGLVVFSTAGDGVPLPAQCASGDLDGDLFWVTWDDGLLSQICARPLPPPQSQAQSAPQAPSAGGLWLEQLQERNCNVEAQREGLDIGSVYGLWEKEVVSNPEGMDGEDALNLAEGYCRTLERGKHGGELGLKPHLQERLKKKNGGSKSVGKEQAHGCPGNVAGGGPGSRKRASTAPAREAVDRGDGKGKRRRIGVYLHTKSGRWRAQITIPNERTANGRLRVWAIGTYNDATSAMKAYDEACRTLHGVDTPDVNFPLPGASKGALERGKHGGELGLKPHLQERLTKKSGGSKSVGKEQAHGCPGNVAGGGPGSRKRASTAPAREAVDRGDGKGKRRRIGVHLHTQSGRWRAQITIPNERAANGLAKRRMIGTYNDATSAMKAYDEAKRALWGVDTPNVNFPLPGAARGAATSAGHTDRGASVRKHTAASQLMEAAFQRSRAPAALHSQTPGGSSGALDAPASAGGATAEGQSV